MIKSDNYQTTKSQKEKRAIDALALSTLDALPPSLETIALIQNYIDDKLELSQILELVIKKYREEPESVSNISTSQPITQDPYLYKDTPALRNLLNIRDRNTLNQAEADVTYIKLFLIDDAVKGSSFDTNRLLAIHKHIFGDVYEWAGQTRNVHITKSEKILGGDTVRYSTPKDIKKDCDTAIKKLNQIKWTKLDNNSKIQTFAKLTATLWQVHPFREGNTRTVITFATQFAETHGFKINKTLLKHSENYLRNALVKASDGEYSDYQYLTKIFQDALYG